MSTASTSSATAVQFRFRLSNVSVVSVVAVTLRAWNAEAMRSSENAVTPIEVPIGDAVVVRRAVADECERGHGHEQAHETGGGEEAPSS